MLQAPGFQRWFRNGFWRVAVIFPRFFFQGGGSFRGRGERVNWTKVHTSCQCANVVRVTGGSQVAAVLSPLQHTEGSYHGVEHRKFALIIQKDIEFLFTC